MFQNGRIGLAKRTLEYCCLNVYVKIQNHLWKIFSQYIGIRCAFWKDYPFTVKNKSFLVRNQMMHKHVCTLVKFLPFIRNTPLKTMYASLNTKELQHKTEEEQMILEKLDKEFMPYNDRTS